MRAVEMLDHRADLLERLRNADVRRAWVGQLTEDYNGKLGRSPAPVFRPEEAKANSAASLRSLIEALRDAETFHVVPELAALTVYTAQQLAETDRIDHTLAPSRSGIARFEGGLPFYDIRGKLLRVSWLVWGPTLIQLHSRADRLDVGEPEEAITVWMWNDHREEPDDIAHDIVTKHADAEELMSRIFGRWGFIGHEMLLEGQRLGPVWADPSNAVLSSMDLLDTVEAVTDPQPFTNIIRLVHAFFLLLGQTVTATHSESIDRPRRRRAERAKLPTRVTVVSLRNVEARRAPGESLVEWSHRWAVRGFWRWQVCGKNHPLAQEIEPGRWRARIWIAPHVKGPKDKPLIISDKVYAVHR
jgi:hypothetical protein